MAPQSEFGHLPLAERMRAGEAILLAALSRPERVFLPGTVIQGQGESAKRVYRIVSGRAARRRTLADGRNQLIAILLPDDLFGVWSLIDGTQHSSIEALTTLSVQSIEREAALRLFFEQPEVALWLFQYANDESARAEQWQTVLGSGSAEEKVAFLLSDLHHRLSARGAGRNGPVRIPLTQRDIGEYVGLTLPHVCRTIATLRERGLVDVHYGSIDVIDPLGLRAVTENVADPEEYDDFEPRRSLASPVAVW